MEENRRTRRRIATADDEGEDGWNVRVDQANDNAMNAMQCSRSMKKVNCSTTEGSVRRVRQRCFEAVNEQYMQDNEDERHKIAIEDNGSASE